MINTNKEKLFLKLADLEGSDDAQFEKILADLGVSFIKDKVPKIMHHLVGFLLLDKNEDHTEAFGVYIIRLDNSEFALVPLIFKNGKVFGYDLLWLPSTKTPLPLTSDWFNFISSKSDNELAEMKVKRDDHYSIGVMPPTLGNMAVPPGGSKTASFISKEAFIKMSKDLLEFASLPINWPVVFLKLAHSYYPYSGIYLEHQFRRDPVFASLFRSYKSYLEKFFKAARARLNYINKLSENLKNYNSGKTVLSGFLGTQPIDKNIIIVKKGSVLDVGILKAGEVRGESRDSSSNIYAVALYRDMVSNPQNTGIYDVYVSPYKTREMLVITDLQHPDISKRFCVVVDISNGEPYAYTVCDKDKIWVDVSGKDHYTRLREWINEKEPAKSLEIGSCNILLNKNGVAIGIVHVDYEYSDQEEKDQQEAYAVSFNSSDLLWPTTRNKGNRIIEDYKSRNWSDSAILRGDCCVDESATASTLLILTKRNGKLRRYAGKWYIPGDFVALQLESSPRPNLVAPHAKIEMESEVLRRTSVINVMQKEGRFYINGKEYSSEEDTIYDLVSKYKLTTKLAKDILTDVKTYGYLEFRAPKLESYAITHARSLSKEAYFPPLPPSLPHGSPPGDVSSSMAFMAGPNAQLATAPFAYPPPLPANLVPAGNPFETYNNKSQAGQLTNVAAHLNAMAKGLKDVSIPFENNANNMIEALTKVGQFLFKIYMNIDDMSKVFGPSNLAQMLINTRDAFKKLGALTLNLLLNTGKDDIGAGHSHDTIDVNIGEEYFS